MTNSVGCKGTNFTISRDVSLLAEDNKVTCLHVLTFYLTKTFEIYPNLNYS